MDLVFWSALAGVVTCVLHTYDIACQWSKNLLKRAGSMPDEVQPSLSQEQLQFKLPKMHTMAHGWKCQPAHSLNFTEGAAMTDGQGIEQNWVQTNAVAPTT